MVIVTIRPWKNFNTSKQLIAIERKVVVQFGCLLEEKSPKFGTKVKISKKIMQFFSLKPL